ncbi:hypothetical protein B0H19DRAFT_1265116 [Mycena capillaripes]|nr:hypothetical protein B0H19DRAFT_1265116 [Mycena capillaripes]
MEDFEKYPLKDTEATEPDQSRVDADEAAGAKIWSVYISEAEKYDKALVESWKSDMEGMLIFAGLFSAILTAFLIESYKTLSPDQGDETVLLLKQISRQLSGIANGSSFDIPTSPSFDPPLAAIVCNALWFVSLGLSLSCALIATLVEQWARDFIHQADMRSAAIIRARIFAYLYYGLKRFKMHAVVEVIPLLLHASLIFFFMGLIAFLIPVNKTLMILSAFLLTLMAVVYIILTILPLLYFDCPYRTPLSGGLWSTVQILQSLFMPSNNNGRSHASASEVSMVDVMGTLAVLKSEQRDERDHRALCWTVRSLADDEELEPFVEGIPDVLWSSHGRRSGYDEHLKVLLHDPEVRLLHRLENFLRGCDSDLLSPETQFRRRVAVLKALWAIATMPRRDGLFLEPLESFDIELLGQTTLPFKIAYYQVSTRTVVNLNNLLSVGGDIYDMTQAASQSKELAVDGYMSPINHLSARLSQIISKLDRLPRHLWQSSTDRENRENLEDLRDNPPTDISETSSWIDQCLGTLESLPSTLVGLEHEMFVSFMIDAAALESWPYEFEATRATFSFDELSVTPDMAGTFSTAFDSIVSHQTQRARYTAHADEILAILLSICASSMGEDPAYFPLNLTSYLTTQTMAESRVMQKCDTLWLSTCLTAELVMREHASALLSGPVVMAMWQVAFLMARQYLDSWTYKSKPYTHARALESVRDAAASHASTSTIALIQTNILNAMSPTPHEFDNMEALNTLPVYPILPNAHPPSTSLADSELNLSILTMRVIILADFIEHCVGTGLSLPFNAIQTLSILTDFLPSRPGVRAAYQVQFARSWSAAFAAQDAPQELLEALSKGKLLSVYWDDGPRDTLMDDYLWLDDPLAAQIFTESLKTYVARISGKSELTKRLATIKKSLDDA